MTAVASNRANELPIKSAIAIAVSMAVGGHAEQAQAQDDDTASVGIEEIIVTARKREQSLQDVSASVQAISVTHPASCMSPGHTCPNPQPAMCTPPISCT